jgi:hypothetical protein
VVGDAAGVLQHPGRVQQVPRHERGVAVGEVVLRAARTRVEVGRAGPASPIQPASACGGMVPGGEHGAYTLAGPVTPFASLNERRLTRARPWRTPLRLGACLRLTARAP